ncbi:PepSY-associated TM helix domain-containing protein [Azotobacter sp. CWF10]
MLRSFRLGTLRQWHWISVALSLAGRRLFAIIGLLLLQRQAAARPGTWPLTGLGLLLPPRIASLFTH